MGSTVKNSTLRKGKSLKLKDVAEKIEDSIFEEINQFIHEDNIEIQFNEAKYKVCSKCIKSNKISDTRCIVCGSKNFVLVTLKNWETTN